MNIEIKYSFLCPYCKNELTMYSLDTIWHKGRLFEVEYLDNTPRLIDRETDRYSSKYKADCNNCDTEFEFKSLHETFGVHIKKRNGKDL